MILLEFTYSLGISMSNIRWQKFMLKIGKELGLLYKEFRVFKQKNHPIIIEIKIQ
jgi:hypothetical protein